MGFCNIPIVVKMFQMFCNNIEYYLFVLRLKAVFLKLYFHWTSTFLSLPLYLPLSSKAFRPKCPGPHLRAKVTQILPVIRSSWGQTFIIIVIIIIVITIIINIVIASSNSPTYWHNQLLVNLMKKLMLNVNFFIKLTYIMILYGKCSW